MITLKFVQNRWGIFLLTSLIFSELLSGQKVQILSKSDSTPIPFVNVQIIDLQLKKEHQLISDTTGFFKLPSNNKFLVLTRVLSFTDYSDTLSGNHDHFIYLEQSNFNIDRVVVTGRVKPQLADKSIYRIDVIDQKIIESKAANSLGDVLTTELGIQYRSEGVLGDFIRIQGLTGEHIKILLDGVPISGRTGGLIDLNQINLENIAHIEIIEGPMSVLYGSSAMAIVNLISKQPSNEQATFNLTAYSESEGIYNFNGQYSKSFNQHALSGHIARNFNSGWSPNTESRFKYFKPKAQYIGGINYEWRTERFDMQLQSDLVYEKLQDLDSVHPGIIFDEITGNTTVTYLATDFYHFTTRLNNRLNYRRILNKSNWIGFQMGYSYFKKRKDSYTKDLSTLEQSPSSNPELFDTTFYHTLQSKLLFYSEEVTNTEIQTGIDFTHEQSEGKRTKGKQHINDAAFFANLLYRPVEFFSLQPGVRAIYNSTFKAPVIYSINTLYNPGNFRMRASLGRSFRAPSLKELYIEFIDNNHHILGNPDLEPENGYNISFNSNYTFIRRWGKIVPEISLFYNNIEHAIQLALDLDRPGYGHYFNIDESSYKTKGFRFHLSSNFTNSLSIGAGIAQTEKSKLNIENQYSSSTDFSVDISYTFAPIDLTTNIQYKYTGKYYDYVGTFNFDQELTGILEQEFSGYQIMNLVFMRKFIKDKLNLSFGIKNIFDITLIETKGTLNVHGGGENNALAGYGRTYFIKLKYRFNKHAL